MLKKEQPKGRMFYYGYLMGIGILGISFWYFYDKHIFDFMQKVIPYDVLFVFMILLVTTTSFVEIVRAYRQWRLNKLV